jgi:hypothetical protein
VAYLTMGVRGRPGLSLALPRRLAVRWPIVYSRAMKHVLSAAALCLAMASGAFALCPDRMVTSTADRFSGVTMSRTSFKSAWGPATPNLYAFVSGQDVAFALIFTSITEQWHYLRCTTTFLLADSKPVFAQVTKTVTSGSAGIEAAAKAAQEKALADTLEEGKRHPKHILPHAVLAETVTLQLDAEAVAKLGAASKIEYKICNDEMVASPEFVAAAREFACKVARQGSGALVSPPSSAVSSPAETPLGGRSRTLERPVGR